MGLFSRKDPTADWPPAGPTPDIDLEHLAVGPVALGDSLERAKTLGRPLKARGEPSASFLLDYGAYDLQFKDGRLQCAGFDLDQAGRVTVAGFTLSPATTPLDAKAWFGEPASDSQEGTLRWLDYERGGATLALEFDEGKLGCVQLYAKGW